MNTKPDTLRDGSEMPDARVDLLDHLVPAIFAMERAMGEGNV